MGIVTVNGTFETMHARTDRQTHMHTHAHTHNTQVAVFLDCPTDQSIYLDPNLDETTVTWSVSRIPTFFSDLVVRNNIPAPPQSFGVGVQEIVYTAGPLDVGEEDLRCAFAARVRHGFSLLVESIAHVTAGGTVHDFFLADGNLVAEGGARPRSFDGNVLVRPLAIGLFSLQDEPFTLFAKADTASRFIVQMQWCEAGVTFGSDAVFSNGTTVITLLRPSDADIAAGLAFTAPRWLNCPTAPVVAKAARGRTFATARWNELVATDNVAVTSVDSTHTSGDNFTIVGSPHTVTYTASDGIFTTVCVFEVEVEFDPVVAEVSAVADATFPAVVEELPLQATHTVTQHLIGGGINDTSLPWFRLEVGVFTAVRFVITPPPGELFFVRTVASADRGQMEVNLAYAVDGASVDVDLLAHDADAVVSYSLDGFALDNTPAVDDLTELEREDTLVAHGSLDNVFVHIDAEQGLFVVHGSTSDTFQRGFSFASLTLEVSFPLGRNFTKLLDRHFDASTAPPTIPVTTIATTTTMTAANVTSDGTGSTTRFSTASTAMTTTTAASATSASSTAGASSTSTNGTHTTTSVTSSTVTAASTTTTATATTTTTDGGPWLTLAFLATTESFVGFKVFVPAADNDDHTGFLSLLDTQAPFFRRRPFSIEDDVDVVLLTEPGQAYAVANCPDPVASDNRGADGLVFTSNITADGMISLLSPTADPYAMYYEVRDLFDNTARCDFFVAVEDHEPPSVWAVAEVNVSLPSAPHSAANPVLATVMASKLHGSAAASDNSGGTTTWVAPMEAVELARGRWQVTVSAMDAWGNTGQRGGDGKRGGHDGADAVLQRPGSGHGTQCRGCRGNGQLHAADGGGQLAGGAAAGVLASTGE